MSLKTLPRSSSLQENTTETVSGEWKDVCIQVHRQRQARVRNNKQKGEEDTDNRHRHGEAEGFTNL